MIHQSSDSRISVGEVLHRLLAVLRRGWARAYGLAPIEEAGIDDLTSYNRTRATEGLGMLSEV